MWESIGLWVVGAILLVLGFLNRRGEINSLHWYHRQRVSEEDRLPFGKAVGLGNIIIGLGLITFGVCEALTRYTSSAWCVTVGTVLLIASVLVGLGISFWAMIKYNRGIF